MMDAIYPYPKNKVDSTVNSIAINLRNAIQRPNASDFEYNFQRAMKQIKELVAEMIDESKEKETE